MVLLSNQKIKIFLSILFIICTSIIIYMQMRKPILSVSKVSTNEKESKIQIKSNLPSKYDVKLYKKTQDENEFTEVKSKEATILNKANTFEINTEDKAKPDNVTNLKTSIVDDYIIISFDPAKDKGTEYEYYLSGNKKDDSIETEVSKEYSLSGIKGYNYIIDNTSDNEAGFAVNKIDNEPILYKGIQWNKNYYLHIRSIDNNNNFSENITYKINLPSKGLKMQYIDFNSNSEISPDETIIGNANDEYNIKEYNKQLEGYQLIRTDGDEIGTLKKERINVKYMYAKNSTIIVRYLNKLTGKEIADCSYINGYEGKEYKINPKLINNYKYNGETISGKMIETNTTVNLYYDEISNVNIKYIDYITGKDIIPNETIKDIVGKPYSINAKEIIGYDFYKVEGNEKGTFETNTINISYYYKKKAKLIVKHVDVDTKTELQKEEIEGYEGDKITVSSKEFEGYILKDNNEESNEISKDNIIDEILQEEYIEKPEEEENLNQIIEHNFQQYDIVMGCGNNEYIIYYKKR